MSLCGHRRVNTCESFLNVFSVFQATVLKVDRIAGSSLKIGSILKEIFYGSEKVFHTARVRDLLWQGVTVVNCTVTDQMSLEAKMVCGVLKPQLPLMVTEHEPGIFKMAYFRHVSYSQIYLSTLMFRQLVNCNNITPEQHFLIGIKSQEHKLGEMIVLSTLLLFSSSLFLVITHM